MDEEYDIEIILFEEYEKENELLTIDLPFYPADYFDEMEFFTEEEILSLLDTTESL